MKYSLKKIRKKMESRIQYSKYLVLFLCNFTIQITLISNIILQAQNDKQLHIKSGTLHVTNSKPTNMLVDKETDVSL